MGHGADPVALSGRLASSGIGAARIEATEQQSDVVVFLERPGKLEHCAFAAAQRVGVTVRQDDAAWRRHGFSGAG